MDFRTIATWVGIAVAAGLLALVARDFARLLKPPPEPARHDPIPAQMADPPDSPDVFGWSYIVEPPPEPCALDGPVYTVVQGDTWSSLAEFFYHDPRLYRFIEAANPHIAGFAPKPGDRLAIPSRIHPELAAFLVND